MTETFIQNAMDRGALGSLWLKKTPALIKELEGRWGLTVGAPFALSYNYVARAQLDDGTPAVLKIGFPGSREFQTEMEALRAYDGDGAARLIRVDAERAVMLIECLDPGVQLSAVEDDEQATRILASVMKRLWRPAPSDRFSHVAEWARGIDLYYGLTTNSEVGSRANHPVGGLDR